MSPVYPIVRERIELHGRYPQMARRDAAIWERFLGARGGEFEAVSYNVALGGLVPTVDGATEAELLGWQYATAKKIDAVVWRSFEVWVVEVKPNASLSALGQVLGYTLLMQREQLTDWPIVPVVVTDQADADVRYVADQLNVQLETYP